MHIKGRELGGDHDAGDDDAAKARIGFEMPRRTSFSQRQASATEILEDEASESVADYILSVLKRPGEVPELSPAVARWR